MGMEVATERIVIDEADYWREAPPIVGPPDRHPKEFVIIHAFVSQQVRDLLILHRSEKSKCQIVIQRDEQTVWEFSGKVISFEEKSKTSTSRYLVSISIQFIDAVDPAFFLKA